MTQQTIRLTVNGLVHEVEVDAEARKVRLRRVVHTRTKRPRTRKRHSRPMNAPGPEHFIFIPGVLLIGIVLGYIMGARAAKAQIDRRRRRARE